ncbi:type I restriction enzyme S subunit [Halanaerobium congolense]|uniref:Type I restriction enzyme S subunit n=1 Tax=Halanaerobium congolense TaxID=54121 RepID=A0A4R8GPC9_9FIRM|nr:restriction endonuclease subunit S [Halanaerobium congolense]TDP20690.1 type I restriction enzyme S subunit [Halanaerobium congolense]TDX46548.1 type I restriction enzyme S subunit [Halanaerobium congolense]
MVKEGYKEVRVGPKTKLIPEEWKVKKLKKVIKKRKGKRPNKLFDSKNGENSIPYLSVNYLRGNDFPEWCSKNDDNKVEVKENEILMIWDGSYSGNVFMGFNGALSSTMARLKCEDDINNQYLFYQLRNNFKIFQSTTIGTSVPHVAGKIFENLNIPTPPKREQKKIASILSSVDKSIEKTDKVIEETKEMKKGLMQELLTKGIGHSEFKEVRIGAKRIEIPKHWEISTVNELTSKVQYGISDKMYLEGQYPIFRMNNFYRGYMIDEPMKYIDLDDTEFEKYKVKKGDILFNRTNSVDLVGKNGIFTLEGDYVFASYLIRLRTNDKCDSYYLNYYLNSYNAGSILDSIATRGASQANINAKNLKSVDVPTPPIQEQKKIASILSSVDAKIQKEEEYKVKLEQLKKGLMQKLLTGEIRVNTEMEV